MKNLYKHNIELTKITIRNDSKEKFSSAIVDLPYRGYEVESCKDGRTIVITKPGGKKVFGQPKKDDILVFIYNQQDETLWQISHKQIYDDIAQKCNVNPNESKIFLQLLKMTLEGEEPEDFINEILDLNFDCGEKPEVLIKAYKWIWGQEDVNYPNGEGRYKSWKPYEELIKDL